MSKFGHEIGQIYRLSTKDDKIAWFVEGLFKIFNTKDQRSNFFLCLANNHKYGYQYFLCCDGILIMADPHYFAPL